MKAFVKIISIVSLSLALSGCVTNIMDKIESDKTSKNLMLLQVGMSQSQVIALMGMPYRREVYGNKEFLIYETDSYASNKLRFTPVYLEDGKVVGWGSKYYDDPNIQKIEADIRIRKK